MKLFTKLAVISTLAVIFTTSAYAQLMRVAVPFNFHAGTEMLPAGEYILNLDQARQRITVVSLSGDRACYIPMKVTVPRTQMETGFLQFSRYGTAHFLHRVLPSGISVGAELFASRAEREVASRNTGREIATVYGLSR